MPAYCSPCSAPCVCVCDPSSTVAHANLECSTARDAVKRGTPLVVINGTGQAADIIAYAWEFLHDTRCERWGPNMPVYCIMIAFIFAFFLGLGAQTRSLHRRLMICPA